MSVLNQPHFHDEAAAFAKLESIVWPDGPVCPHCGATDRIYPLVGVKSKPSKKNPEGVVRHGLKKCGHCRQQFTARVGTVFESSHIELHKWFQLAHLLCSSKKGISSHQLHRILKISYKAAWFASHRLREAMRVGELTPMGGGGGVVEADETYTGRKRGFAMATGGLHKFAVLTLVSRSGEARSFHIENVTTKGIMPIIRANLSAEAKLVTDTAPMYRFTREHLASHETVNHSAGEYVRGAVHTNTVEGCFSVFKRGMKGVYQHCSEKHLHRYLAEFDFRYSNRVKLGVDDGERASRALLGVKGKRLTYQTTGRSRREAGSQRTPPV